MGDRRGHVDRLVNEKPVAQFERLGSGGLYAETGILVYQRLS